MSNMKQELSTSLFGLDREAVDQSVSAQAAQDETMCRYLEAELAKEQSLQEQYRLLLSRLQELAEDQQALDVQLGDSLRQADETGQFVSAALNQYVHLLEGEAAERRRADEARISALAGQAARIIEQLEQIATQMGSLAAGSRAGSDAPPATAPANAGVITPFAPPLPSERRPEAVRPLSVKSPAPESAGRRVLPFRTAPVERPVPEPESSPVAAAYQPEPDEEPAPAVAEWRPGDVAGFAVPAKRANSGHALPLSVQEATGVEAAATGVTEGQGGGRIFAPAAQATAQPSPAAQTEHGPAAQASQSAPPTVQADAPAPTPAAAAETSQMTAPAVGPAPSATPAAQVETGLKQRLALNMSRMLEGKAVGQELKDSDGHVLAARGTLITPELAARAEAAGVLPDLILHMAWPEEVDV